MLRAKDLRAQFRLGASQGAFALHAERFPASLTTVSSTPASMVREHLWGVLNVVTSGATNALGESIHAKSQRIQRTACGFRNRGRFRSALFLHLGGLDLYPATLPATHTAS